MLQEPFYSLEKTYDDNFDNGPFGKFNDGKIFSQQGEPEYTFLGHSLYLPFGIGPGPLLNSRYIKAAFQKGFDVVYYKTQRSHVFPCNPFPNIVILDIDGKLTIDKTKKPISVKNGPVQNLEDLNITNSFGNPSKGPEFWQTDMKKAVGYEQKGQIMIASVVGTIIKGMSEEDYYDDFALTARLAKETGVKVIELNLACPNVASEGVLCYTKSAVVSICRKSKEVVGDIPLIVKLGYYTPDQQPLLEEIMKEINPFISGVCVINTIPGQIVDRDGKQALPGVGRLTSGICGAGIKWAGLDMVGRLAKIKESLKSNFAILGVGGVMDANDYLEYRDAGCDVVLSATAAIWNPYMAQEIKKTENIN